MSKLAQDTITALLKKNAKDLNSIRMAGELLHEANTKLFELAELNGEKTSVREVREIEKLLLLILKEEKKPAVILDLLLALGKSRNKSLLPLIKKYLIRSKFPRHLFDSFFKKKK